jgi:hypothetical protein
MSDQYSPITDLGESDEWVVYNSPNNQGIADSEKLLTKAINILTKTEQLQTKLSEQVDTIQTLLSNTDQIPSQNVRDYNRTWRSYGNNPYLPYLGSNLFANFPISKQDYSLGADNLRADTLTTDKVLPDSASESSGSSDNEIQ